MWKKDHPAGNQFNVQSDDRADDARLYRAALAGDQRAFEALVDRHGRYLFGVAHALIGNTADADDLVQQTFLAALTGNFRGESSLRTWLVGILVRQSQMLKRSRGRRPAQSLIDEPPASGNPAAATDAKLDLTVMLATLSPEHRQVIVMREIEAMTYEQMAEALDVPRGTIESRLHRARQDLRQRFGDASEK